MNIKLKQYQFVGEEEMTKPMMVNEIDIKISQIIFGRIYLKASE